MQCSQYEDMGTCEYRDPPKVNFQIQEYMWAHCSCCIRPSTLACDEADCGVHRPGSAQDQDVYMWPKVRGVLYETWIEVFFKNCEAKKKLFRVQGKCKTGARTSSCCAHVCATIYACGILAHNPQAWHSTWHEYNVLDTRQPNGYTTDMLAGLYS